jgi:hypothetical protein
MYLGNIALVECVLSSFNGHHPTENEASMTEGSLFCFLVMRSTESGCFRLCSWWNN